MSESSGTPGRADASNAESFYAADRRVGSAVGAMSLTATQISAGTLIGTIGIHYAVGASFGLVWVGIWCGWITSLLLVGPHLRARGGITVSEFLSERFDGDGVAVGGTAAALVSVIYLVYTTAQYVAGAVVLDAVFGLPRIVGIAAFAAVALSYTLVGGMRLSVYSDAVQVAALLVGVVTATVVGVGRIGGVGALLDAAATVDPALVSGASAPALTVGLALSFGFGIAVAPYELSRVYAMRDPETVRRAIPLSIGIQAVIAVCVLALGLLARVRFPGLADPDASVVRLALDLFGPVVGLLLLGAVVAAVLSTVDSVLLVTSAAVAHDIYERTLPALGIVDDPEPARVRRVSRLATVGAAAVPAVLAVDPGPFGGVVQLIVALYTSVLGATLFVPVLGGLHWEAATRDGALAGIVGGFVAATGWQVVTEVSPIDALGPLVALDPVVPGVAASAIGFVGASLLDRGRAG
ncbi:sodium:solute symporter family protein [Halorubrum sp. SS5]|nr:sodium:solute symporter family protein [Halorubrum sp. SS5]